MAQSLFAAVKNKLTYCTYLRHLKVPSIVLPSTLRCFTIR